MANSNELVLMEELDDELLGEAAGSAAVDPGNQSAEAPQQDQAKAITKLIEMTQKLDEKIKSQEVQIGKMKKERQELCQEVGRLESENHRLRRERDQARKRSRSPTPPRRSATKIIRSGEQILRVPDRLFFYGAKNQNFPAFLDQFSVFYPEGEPETLLAQLRCHLDDTALQLLDRWLDEDPEIAFDDVCHYFASAWPGKKGGKTTLRSLHTRKQQIGESINDYAVGYRILAAALREDPDRLITEWLEGLSQLEVHHKVLIAKPTSFSEAVELAQQFSSVITPVATVSSTITNDSNVSDDIKKTLADIGSKLANMERATRRWTASSHSEGARSEVLDRPRDSRGSSSNGSSYRRPISCFCCGGDHKLEDCPEMVCPRCNTKGHIPAKCPKA